MLCKLHQALNRNKRQCFRLHLQMFHRAASSATLQESLHSTEPQALGQSHAILYPKIAVLPLSPSKSSVMNGTRQSHLELRQPNQSQKSNLLHTIKDEPGSQGNDSQSAVKENTAVYYNEDDFDDDLDFNFENIAEVPHKQLHKSSSAISWPPSSYLAKSPVQKDSSVHVDKAKSETLTQIDKVNPERSSSLEAGSTPPRKPRTLPWQRESLKHVRQFGPPVKQMRTMASTSAALSQADEADQEEVAEIAQALHKRDPYAITGSAIKAAIKSRGKKRAADAVEAPRMQPVGRKSTTGSEVAKVFLSAEQRGVIDLLKTGKSVFFTGSAGTGKSVLLRSAIKELRDMHKTPDKVAVTASTGLAACNIGGITLHSFAGVGLGRDDVPEMVKKVKRNKKNVLKWTKTKVLVIDEISMVDAEFYDKLEAVARQLRGNDRPWGGLQIVATGDFFQLPPVPDRNRVAKFAFEAEKWKDLHATIQLTTVFRQKDEEFVEMLNQMRTGSLTDKTISNFKKLSRPLQQDDGITPTELFPTRHEVDTANTVRMRQLPGETRIFEAEDSGSITDLQQRAKLLSNCMAPAKLELKRGAQVMLIKNRDDGLVNGSLGVIVGFMNERTYTYALEASAYEIDAQFLRDSPWTDEELYEMSGTAAGKRKALKLRQLEATAASQKAWPLVRFKNPSDGHDVTQLMAPESWKIEQPNGEVQACRKQVPLILAYAISIHKAQGQTIEKVKVDLGKVFEKGQAYVALSRAVSKEGLQVLRFDVKRVMAHPKVAAFYRELAVAGDAIEQHDKAVRMSRTTSAAQSIATEDTCYERPMSTQQVFSQIKREPLKAFSRVPRH